MVVRTRVGAAGMEQQGHTPDTLGRWSLLRPADGMGGGCKRRGGLWCLRHEEGEGQGLHLLSWGRW